VCFYILRRRNRGKKSGFVHLANKSLHFRAKTRPTVGQPCQNRFPRYWRGELIIHGQKKICSPLDALKINVSSSILEQRAGTEPCYEFCKIR
jgi:hypothetical protein